MQEISLQIPSTAISGINYYQYCISTSSANCNGEWTNFLNGATNIQISTIGIRYIYYRAISNSGKIGKISDYQITDIKDPNLLRFFVDAKNSGTMYCQYYNLNGDLVTASLTTGSENDLYVKPNTKVVIWASNWQSSNTINPQPSINNHTSLANVTKAYFMKPNVALHLIHILYDGDGSYKTWFQQEGLENLNIYKYE